MQIESLPLGYSIPEVQPQIKEAPPREESIIINEECADGTLLELTPENLVVFTTQSPAVPLNINRLVSHDRGQSWSQPEACLPPADPGWQRWAPESTPGPVNGLYALVYAEHHSRRDLSRLRLAFAESPLDTYSPLPDPILIGPSIHHLDPQLVFHNGLTYLLEGSGWRPGDGIRIWPMDFPSGQVSGPSVTLVENVPGHPDLKLIEGAHLQIVPASEYPFQLHYCGSDYRTNYCSRLLVARNILGPYINPWPGESNIFLSGAGSWDHPGQVSITPSDLAIFHVVPKGQKYHENRHFHRPAMVKTLHRDHRGIPVPMTP